MAEYDKRFEEMEEEVQTATGEAQTTRVNTNSRILELQKEIEMLHKEEETLALAKQKEKSAITQERVEYRKTIKILEKNIEALSKDKAALEHKLADLKSRNKGKLVSMVDRETQTAADEDRKSLIGQRRNEFSSLQSYSDSLKSEVGLVTDRLKAVSARLEQSEQDLQKKGLELELARGENEKLVVENKDLKIRRVKAMAEINKLNKLVTKYQDDSSQSKGRTCSKRYSSEAVQ
eukprot:TRINITY_DN5025_c0_g5_i1.p2 TRINITY_DN5025_c0_g5~~TRINITY_DN5025_c0_g5_i1.p2  ORF type:complete len:234 (+),score=105.81 TRINITY_DN5025_c0_g5_i1:554-1255(+)